MIKTYRFYFTLGVPVFSWPDGNRVEQHKFRKSSRSVFGYSLTDAIERFSKSVVTKHGIKAKLYLEQAFVSTTCSPRTSHREDWKEISVDSATLAAFVVGVQSRELLKDNL